MKLSIQVRDGTDAVYGETLGHFLRKQIASPARFLPASRTSHSAFTKPEKSVLGHFDFALARSAGLFLTPSDLMPPSTLRRDLVGVHGYA